MRLGFKLLAHLMNSQFEKVSCLQSDLNKAKIQNFIENYGLLSLFINCKAQY